LATSLWELSNKDEGKGVLEGRLFVSATQVCQLVSRQHFLALDTSGSYEHGFVHHIIHATKSWSHGTLNDGFSAPHMLKSVTHAVVELHSGFGDEEGSIESCEIHGSLWTSPTF